MESGGAEKIPGIIKAEASETTIEIKIKTLDSQTYTLKVDKQVINIALLSLFLLKFWPCVTLAIHLKQV